MRTRALMRRRRMANGIYCVLTAFFWAGYVGAAVDPTVLRRGTASELRSLDPQAAIGNSAGALMYDLFEGLVTVDGQGQLIPGAAGSWAISDDGLTYTFFIRQGLRWSDGVPLTAEDFVYTLRRIVKPDNALRGAGTISPIRNALAINRGKTPPSELGVKALDATTLVITLEHPAPYFIDMLAAFPAAAVPRHVIEKHGFEWTMPGNMVGSGAYVLDEWISSTHYKLVRNPHFRDAGQVQIDEVYYYPIPDKETAVMRFRVGELDVTLNVPPNRLKWLQQNLPDKLRISSKLGIRYLIVNTTRPSLNDVRVRKALSLSVNREIIASQILKDGSEPAYNLVPSAMPGYGPNPAPFKDTPYEQRLAEARQLLAEAGFDAGNPLRFTVHFRPVEDARRVVVALQAMWRGIGADVELVNIGSQGKAKILAAGEFDMALFTYYVPFSDAMAFLRLLEAGSFRNYSRYDNPEFDQMLATADKYRDPSERAAYLKRAEQLAISEHPVIPLFVPARIYLVSDRVRGWEDHTEPHLARHLSVSD